ncbi:hypothetical protein GTA08_BOTSDO12229 [Botryosphaeria dothidea]|uniref:Uncharacterized protein n=1 Tax=Botryosphaeria dothidea TaxID=55169 RepID=A0A8H4N5N3_9PEZI|nr:hypothetical protein GTA08_BOTSDO12229 [Botryosphaeria dothidea]
MKPLPAACESADESSDSGRPTKPSQSRSRSNVAVKRSSQSSDLGRTNAGASDSGYSSRTAATKSSADSAQSSSNRRGSPVKNDAPPSVPDAPTPTKPRAKQPESASRKSTQGRETTRSIKTSKAPKSSKTAKPLIRQSSSREKSSSTSRPRRDSGATECQDPYCDRCQEKRLRGGRPLSLNTAVDPNYPAYPPQSPRMPSSPSRPPYGPEHPFVQTQVASSTRPRFYSQGRPTSYHGGSALSDRYSYGQPNNPYGPPHTMYNPHYATMMGSTTPTAYYSRVPPSPLSGSFDNRPQLPSRGISDGYTPRPQPQNLPNPRYPTVATAVIPSRQPYDEEDYSSEEDEDGYYPSDSAALARRAMPPPPAPVSTERPRRPSLRSHTTTDVPRSRPVSIGFDNRDRPYEDEPSVMTRSLQLQPSRRPSVTGSRRLYYPSYSKGDDVLVETARSDRRRESESEKLRRNTIYNKNVVPRLRLDDTLLNREARADDKKKNKLDSKMNMVEAYLNTTGNSYGAGIDSLPTKPSRDRAPSNGARTRTSSNSQHSHDDISRVSDGSRSTSTRKTAKDGNLTVRVDGDDVKIEGDMGGKTFRITNGDDGNQQITIIADPRGRENKYLMEGSRVTTNTSSSRSRSDRGNPNRPRAVSRSQYERALEIQQAEQRKKREKRVSYVDDATRIWPR